MLETSAAAPSDSVLVARCLEHEEEAWELIVRRYHRRLFNIAYQFVGRVEEAEDLTQEIFLKLYHSLDKFDRSASLVNWLVRVAKNHCVDYYRRKRREMASVIHDEELLTVVQSRGKSPLGQFESKENSKRLRDAMARLPEHLRLAVLLRDIQDLSYQEIAERLGIPEGTVKSRINRGRAELARRLR
ncbi:MAG TPA: sigma-70 family RNA polymerase sigma factor [Acidobacteriota bacterium]